MRPNRWLSVAVLISFLLEPARTARAQDGATLDDVRKMYQDALVQLKAAQDRKSELANENAKLAAHVAELEKQLEAARHEATGVAERTFLLRARYAAWETFMKQYPDLLERWKLWLQDNAGIKPGTLPAMGDDDWPFGKSE